MPFIKCAGPQCNRRIWLGEPRNAADETPPKSEAIRAPGQWSMNSKTCSNCGMFCDKCAKGGIFGASCPRCGGKLRKTEGCFL